jgi:hypothetical protein
VQELLDRAFQRPLDSMDLKLDAEVAVEGVEGLDKPIRILASGPYRSNEGKLPSFDIDLDLSAGGPGSTVSTGRLSTGDRAFVKFGDSYYEVDPKEVATTNRQLDSEGGRCTRRGIAIDPRPWIENAEDRGEEQVAGVSTTHVSGSLDVDRMLRDLNEFVTRCGSVLGTAAGQTPDPLSQDDLDKIAQVVSDPSFDIYVGEDDGIIRRLSASLSLKVPQEDQESVGGIEGGSLKFSIEFANVNGDQAIEPPSRSRPLAELTAQLGGNALSGGLGLDNGSPESEDREAPPATGEGGGPAAEDYQNYADCLDRIDPADTAALERCSALLNAP